MFCGKCGSKIPDNVQFCPFCGNQTQENAATTPAQTEATVVLDEPVEQPTYYAPVYTEPAQEQTPKKKVNWKRILGISVPCVLLAVVIALCGSYIGNAFAKLFSSSDGYFRYVAKGALEDVADSYVDVYEDYVDFVDLKGKNSLSISVEAGRFVQRLVSRVTNVDIGEMGKVSVTLDTYSNKKTSTANLSLFVADSKDAVVSVQGGYKHKDQQFMATLPGLTEEWIGIDLTDFGLSDSQMELLNQLISIDFAKIFPEGKTIKKIIMNGVDAALKEIDEVKESSGTFSVGDISQKGTLLTVELDEKTLMEMGVAFLEAVQDDKALKKAVLDTVKRVEKLDLDWKELVGSELPDGDEIYDLLVEGINDVLQDAKDSIPAESANPTILNLYVNGRGDIYAVEVVNEGKYGTMVVNKQVFSFGVVTNGSKVNGGCKLVTNDQENMAVTLTGTYSMFGGLDGTLSAVVDGEEYLTGEISGLKISKNRAKGTVKVKPSTALMSELGTAMSILGTANLDASVTFDIGSKKQNVMLNVLSGEESLAKIEIANRVGKAKKVKLPKESKVDFAQSEQDLTEFVQSIDTNALKDILNDVGLGSFSGMVDQLK